MAFENSTRRKVIALGSKTKGTENPLRWDVLKYGLLGGIMLVIRGSITGTLSNNNPLGKASVVRNVRVVTNGGLDLVNISGAGYHYLLRNFIEDYAGDPVPYSDARSAVATGSFVLDMFIPIPINMRDTLGMFPLQNEASLVQLEVAFETDANVATGATVAATVQPFVVIFSLPASQEDWPTLNTVHQILEDTRSITATGDYDYSWPRGNTYLQMLHGYTLGVSGADSWSRARLIVNQSDILYDYTPESMSIEYSATHGSTRVPGTIAFDLMGSSGLGNYGSARDLIYSALVTDIVSRLTFTGTGTLFTIRRQLVLVSD